ncbi:MAG: tRNA (adenosine(37)-N6)-dimethylallyltransferase MiaA, partial [Candidatus Limnocylindria bacterium]
MTPPVAAIVGPTASGKTELALAIARRLPVEILVADSRQVYRGMDIGTAKPGADARAAVPHHLLDLAEPAQPFSVADWVAHARPLVAEIAARGRLALVVGGTGLYLSALLDGYDLSGGPPTAELRARLLAELDSDGLAALARRLAAIDPAAAARADLRNPHRVLRALERQLAGGGGPIPSPSARRWPGRVALVGIERPRDVLDARIQERAAAMFRSGLVDEVRSLLASGIGRELGPMTGH